MTTTTTDRRRCITPTCRKIITRGWRCPACLDRKQRHGDHIAPTTQRIPWEPLRRWVIRQHGEDLPQIKIAPIIGVDPGQVIRWKRTGLLIDQADRIAIRFGVHPTAIWGDAFWAGTVVDGTVDPSVDFFVDLPARRNRKAA